MMHTTGKYTGAQKTLDGRTQIILEIDDEDIIDSLQELGDEKLKLELEKYHSSRSLNANRYLWKLCGLIAEKLGSDKDTIYLMKLKEYGVSDMYEIPAKALPEWEKLWRYTHTEYLFKAFSYGNEIPMVGVRCWKGSHEYDSKEMSVLINGIKQDAEDLGIDTWSDDEIAHAIAVWKAR